MDRSNSYGIVPRRWSDGQDSMQFAGFLKQGHAPKSSFRGRRWGLMQSTGKPVAICAI
jgi:hypothetical protein